VREKGPRCPNSVQFWRIFVARRKKAVRSVGLRERGLQGVEATMWVPGVSRYPRPVFDGLERGRGEKTFQTRLAGCTTTTCCISEAPSLACLSVETRKSEITLIASIQRLYLRRRSSASTTSLTARHASSMATCV
jgi:hypothetical protein